MSEINKLCEVIEKVSGLREEICSIDFNALFDEDSQKAVEASAEALELAKELVRTRTALIRIFVEV